MQAARHEPALPRAPGRWARRHCGAPTGRHGAERSARDTERGGVRGEMRSRATPPNAMTRSADRIPPPIGGRTSAVHPRRCRLDGRLPTGPHVPASQPTPVRALTTRSRRFSRTRCPQLPLGSGRIALARDSAPHAEVSAHESLRTADFPQQEWRSKRARWLLSAICSGDGRSSYDGDSQVISAARP